MKKIFLFLIILSCNHAFAQNKFQKIYTWASDAQCFSSHLLNDGSYVFTGIMDQNGFRLFLAKANCMGNIEWVKTYEPTNTVGNISQRVIQNLDGGFTLAANVGQFGDYDIFIVRTDSTGQSIWKKKITGNGDDLVNSVIQTPDSGFILAGYTNSYGQELGSPYRDVFVVKLDKNGNFGWSKTYGTDNNIDEAFDIVQSWEGGFALCGRYITSEAFHNFLLKTDSIGNVEFLRAYGDSSHNTTGYSIVTTPDQHYVMTGSTTVMEVNFQSYGDVFLMKADELGDTTWCKAYWSNNMNGSDIGSSVVFDQNKFSMSVATFGYPTSGFVPNKYCVMQATDLGVLTLAKIYMDQGSHYPYLSKSVDDQGYIITGFSNFMTTPFNTHVIRTDKAFSTGCNETNVLSITGQAAVPFKVKSPAYVVSSPTPNIVNSTVEDTVSFEILTLCESIIDTCYLAIVDTTDTTDTTGIMLLLHQNRMRIFPNPFEETFYLTLNEDESSNALLQVYNLVGELVEEKILKLYQGENKIPVSLSSVSEGMYILKISVQQKQYTARIIKQNSY